MADHAAMDEMRDIVQAQKDLVRMWGCREEFAELEQYLFKMLQRRFDDLVVADV